MRVDEEEEDMGEGEERCHCGRGVGLVGERGKRTHGARMRSRSSSGKDERVFMVVMRRGMEVPDQQARAGRGGRRLRGRAGSRFRFIKYKYPFYTAVLRSNEDWVDRG